MIRSAALAIALTLLSLPGCGYSQNELFPTPYRTVAVPMFENRTFYRGVERDLSEALVKEIESRTPYKVASPSVADTMLSGTITRIDQDTITRTPDTALPQQQEVSVRVNFTWENLDTGDTLRSRRGFEAVGRYAPTRPVSQFFETAKHQAVQALARDIVSTMRDGFGETSGETTSRSEAADRPAATQPGDG